MNSLFETEPAMRRDATISPCGLYRYTLTRIWNPDEVSMCFIMLNPSTADAERDDPTIRKCIALARSQRWSRGGIVVVNLFAYRATEPADMLAAADPIGPDNDEHIRRVMGGCHPCVAAWGTKGGHKGRDRAVLEMFKVSGTPLWCLEKTKDGHPKHPLYHRKDATEFPAYWNPLRAEDSRHNLR